MGLAQILIWFQSPFRKILKPWPRFFNRGFNLVLIFLKATKIDSKIKIWGYSIWKTLAKVLIQKLLFSKKCSVEIDFLVQSHLKNLGQGFNLSCLWARNREEYYNSRAGWSLSALSRGHTVFSFKKAHCVLFNNCCSVSFRFFSCTSICFCTLKTVKD